MVTNELVPSSTMKRNANLIYQLVFVSLQDLCDVCIQSRHKAAQRQPIKASEPKKKEPAGSAERPDSFR